MEYTHMAVLESKADSALLDILQCLVHLYTAGYSVDA